MPRRVRIDPAHRARPEVRTAWPELAGDGGRAAGAVVTWTPMVFDDAQTCGAAAAVRAVEGVWAAGRDPVGATALVEAPVEAPVRALRSVLHGAEATWHALGVPMTPAEPQVGPLRLGFAVQARAPRRAPRRGARPGDVVFSSRPLGADVLVEAFERGVRSAAQTRALIDAAARPDPRLPLRLAGAGPARLLGPGGLARAALDLAQAWDLDVVFDAARLPLLPGVAEHLLAGLRPPSVEVNRRVVGARVSVARGVSEAVGQVALGAEWLGGVLWVDDRRHGPGVGVLRKKRAARPAVRILAEVE